MVKYFIPFLMLIISCSLKNNDYSAEIKVTISQLYSHSTFIQDFDIDITKKLSEITEYKGYAIYNNYNEFENDLIPSITQQVNINISEQHFDNSILIGFRIMLTGGDTLKKHHIEINKKNIFLKFDVDGYDGKDYPDLAILYIIFYQIEK